MARGLGLGLNNVRGDVIVPPFTPADLSGLVLWLRYNTGLEESDTSAPEDGEQVTKWADASDQGNHATKSGSGFSNYDTTEEAPFFDGSTDSFDINGATGITLTTCSAYLRVKFKEAGETLGGEFFLQKQSSGNFFKVQSSTEIRARMGGGTRRDYTFHTELSEATKYNIGVERTSDASNNVTTYLDGTVNGSGQTISTAKAFECDDIGGAADGVWIYEIVVTSNPLDATERNNLNAWLDSETAG